MMSVLETAKTAAIPAGDIVAALRKRYGEHIPKIGNDWNGILGQLLAQRSIRR